MATSLLPPSSLGPLRARPDVPTKTEMVAVRPVEEPPRPAARRVLLPPIPRDEPEETPPSPAKHAQPVVTPEEDEDQDDRPTAMRDWNAEPHPAVQTRPTHGVLIRLDATCAGMTLPLPEKMVRFGRGRDADVRIDDEGVSRLHAAIRKVDDGYEIFDLESRNGTVVSGHHTKRALLRDGDIIQLGPRVAFRFGLMDERQLEVMRQLFETSVRDGLTGAFNRHHLEERLRGELAYALRHGTELGVLILDVDHFKRVNDTFGHQAGDAVLRHVSSTISGRLRTEDLFARYGGEEFVAVLRGIALAGTARAGERLRAIIAASPTAHEGQTISVTVSIGAASLATTASQSIDALLSSADRRLYVAKAAGRNRVVATDDGSPIIVPRND
ncbi:MAG: diguanylate cyclase [Myxococcales bacterium]|nr:diguanylate cyclase [Myxococcales bacterium]